MAETKGITYIRMMIDIILTKDSNGYIIHPAFNFGNDKFKPITNTNSSDNGYDFLFDSLNNLSAGERFGEISFCREHEWIDSPEEKQWLQCFLH